MENIEIFLDMARAYGLQPNSIFPTSDLFDGKNMAMVIATILQLGTEVGVVVVIVVVVVGGGGGGGGDGGGGGGDGGGKDGVVVFGSSYHPTAGNRGGYNCYCCCF